MKNIALTAVFAFLAISQGNAEDSKPATVTITGVKCKGEKIDMAPFHEGYLECAKQVLPSLPNLGTAKTEEERAEVMKKWHELMSNTCVDLCTWKKTKMFKEDGTYDAENTKKLLAQVFPKSLQDTAIKALEECITENKGSFNNKQDNKCEGYKKFNECKAKKFIEFCDIKMETDMA